MNWRQAITWTSDDPIHWPKYVALGEDELKHKNKAVPRHHEESINSSYISS